MRPTAIALLLVAACSNEQAVISVAPTVPASTTTAPPAEVLFEMQGCRNPPVTFTIVCETHDVLTTQFRRPLTPDVLAAAAVAGVRAYDGDPATESVESFVCAIPALEYDDFCVTVAARATDGPYELADLTEAAVAAMAEAAGDPYTWYLPPDVVRAAGESGYIDGVGFLFDVKNSVGSRCRRVEGPCRTVVVAVSPDSPASRAGLAPDDVVTAADGVSVDGLSPKDLVDVFYGPPGTEMSLDIDRGDQDLIVTIVRTEVADPLVYGELVGQTGYLRLPDFSLENVVLLHYQLEALLNAGARRLVLDLRDNPGGLIAATVVVASEFLSGGLVVVTDGPEGITEYHVEEGGLATSGVPLTVLVNEGSASASEVLAGLLQERGRARLVGATTFGKGSVQIPVRLRNQGILRVTIADWSTPQGTDVGGVGVVPDVALDLPRGLPVAELVALAEAA